MTGNAGRDQRICPIDRSFHHDGDDLVQIEGLYKGLSDSRIVERRYRRIEREVVSAECRNGHVVGVEGVAGIAGADDLLDRNGHHVDLLAGIHRKWIVLIEAIDDSAQLGSLKVVTATPSKHKALSPTPGDELERPRPVGSLGEVAGLCVASVYHRGDGVSQLLQERPAWRCERDAEGEPVEGLDTGYLVGLACQLLLHTDAMSPRYTRAVDDPVSGSVARSQE